MMKHPALFALLLATCCVFVQAADSPSATLVQNGQLSTVRLLKTERVSAKSSPDGLAFYFLVTKNPAATGRFTLKETRDFQIAEQSYQQKTQAKFGKSFEPTTTIDPADKFFAAHPAMAGLAPANLKEAIALTVAIVGAKLTEGANAQITIQVGFGRQLEPFAFDVPVPAGKP